MQKTPRLSDNAEQSCRISHNCQREVAFQGCRGFQSALSWSIWMERMSSFDK